MRLEKECREREEEKEVLESEWVFSVIVSTAYVNLNEASLSFSEIESKRESEPE